MWDSIADLDICDASMKNELVKETELEKLGEVVGWRGKRKWRRKRSWKNKGSWRRKKSWRRMKS